MFYEINRINSHISGVFGRHRVGQLARQRHRQRPQVRDRRLHQDASLPERNAGTQVGLEEFFQLFIEKVNRDRQRGGSLRGAN